MITKEHYKTLLLVARSIFLKLKNAVTDLVPIIVVVAFFQLVVLRQPFPMFGQLVFGGLLVVVGLMLFIEGLEMGLFPVGETMAYALARKGSVVWLLIFSFLLGFSTVVAEPALIAVTQQAAKVAAEGGLIDFSTQKQYALGLRLSVAFSVGVAIILGVLRILKGWPLHYVVMGGYVVVMLMTIIAPKEIIGLAYDTGGVATSTITVPLITALGVGLAGCIKGRNPLTDGFGMIAIAVMLPMIFVIAYGLLIFNL